MKKIFNLFSLIMLVVLAFTACTEDPEITTGAISGYVTESKSGVEPLGGVTVSILGSGQSTTTGSDGTYSFKDMQPGNYSLQFTKTGYNTNMRSVTVTSGMMSQCDIQLTKVTEEADIEVNPSSLNFGTTQTNLSLTIKNNGTAAANWSLDLGNNAWLSASELAGSIQAGRTQSIIFSVDRNYLSEVKTVVVNLHAFGNSYPVTVSCAPRSTSSNMLIEPTVLNFGNVLTEQSFSIRNTGKTELTWHVSEISTQALTLSSNNGIVAPGGNSIVIARIDRSLISGELNTAFVISDGIVDQTITVSVNGSGNNNPGNEDNPGGNDNPGNTGGNKSNGLYAYFPLNGSLDDISGNGHNAFVTTEAKYVPGVTSDSKGLSFSRSDGTAFIVNDGLIDHTAMTVSFWLKDIGEGSIFHVTSSNSSLDNKEMMWLSYTNGHLRYVMDRYHCVYWAFDNLGHFTHKVIDDGEWHHIVLASDFNKQNADFVTTTLYVDGIQMDMIKEDYPIWKENEPEDRHFDTGIKFTLGGSNTPNMKVANFRTYNVVLTADQIKNIYNAKQ